MRARQAKKIIGCQWINTPPYWWNRVLNLLDGKHIDHRVQKAEQIINRKRNE